MESTFDPSESIENILDEQYVMLCQASSGKRFLNYVIDRVIIFVIWKYLVLPHLLKALTLVYAYTESRAALYTLFFFLLYATVFFFLAGLETLTGGRTIGKRITRTRAVNQDGTRITARTAFLRSLSRCVPLEVFSALGSPCFPWHDKWTKTYVIDETESTLPV